MNTQEKIEQADRECYLILAKCLKTLGTKVHTPGLNSLISIIEDIKAERQALPTSLDCAEFSRGEE